MELLQLIIFKSAYLYFNFYEFINLIILFIFLKIIYNKKISINENGDPIIILSNLLYLFLHLIIILLYQINDNIRRFKIGNNILSFYDNLNNKYLYYRIKIISYPILFLTRKLLETPKSKIKKNDDSNNKMKLNNNKDINNFLNKLSKKM